jgi:hypothetical protein
MAWHYWELTLGTNSAYLLFNLLLEMSVQSVMDAWNSSCYFSSFEHLNLYHAVMNLYSVYL